MHKWVAILAGGTHQRLKPSPATMWSLYSHFGSQDGRPCGSTSVGCDQCDCGASSSSASTTRPGFAPSESACEAIPLVITVQAGPCGKRLLTHSVPEASGHTATFAESHVLPNGLWDSKLAWLKPEERQRTRAGQRAATTRPPRATRNMPSRSDLIRFDLLRFDPKNTVGDGTVQRNTEPSFAQPPARGAMPGMQRLRRAAYCAVCPSVYITSCIPYVSLTMLIREFKQHEPWHAYSKRSSVLAALSDSFRMRVQQRRHRWVSRCSCLQRHRHKLSRYVRHTARRLRPLSLCWAHLAHGGRNVRAVCDHRPCSGCQGSPARTRTSQQRPARSERRRMREWPW